MKIFARFTVFVLLAITSLLIESCQREVIGTIDHKQSAIKVTVANIFGTKALPSHGFGERIDSLIIKGDDGEDIVVEAFMSDYTDLPFHPETKGSVVSNQSINEVNSKFIVNAWLGSENRYSGSAGQLSDGSVYETADATDYHFIKDGNALKGTDWTLKDNAGNEYEWRNAVPTTFWSHYPEAVSGKVTRSITFPGDQAADDEQNKISFSYSISSDAKATDLKDILFAYNLEKVEYERNGRRKSGSETIDVHFYHALPAVRFDVSGLVRKDKVIKSITLEGLVSSGSCNAEGATGGIDFSDWTLGSGKVTVRQEFAASDFTDPSVEVNPETGSSDPNTLQSFTNDKIFFPLPQPIKGSGVKITIEYSHTGDDVVLTKSFVLDHDTDWKPGKYYTYRLSVSGVDVYVHDKVTDNVKNDLVIKNVGAEQAYIRAYLSGNWVNKDGDILMEWDPEDTSVGTIFWGSGRASWTKGADGFYYHKASVSPGVAAAKLFESYTITSPPSILEDSDYLEFIITAQSVLADAGKASAIAAWGSTAASYLND